MSKRRLLMPTVIALAFLLTFFLFGGQAVAQTDSRLAIGGSVTTRLATSSEAGGGADIGFEWRLGYAVPGWGWQNSLFSWFDSAVVGTIAGAPGTAGAGTLFELGNMRLRPIMAGYGYTWVRGKTAITADLVGGYSLNSFKIEPAALQEYSRRRGATGVEAEGTNSFALKPEVQIWYDINSRFGLKLNGGYLISRPSVVITSSLGEDIRPVKADTFLITAGLVYSLF
jgi:hypothetical protein